MINFTPIANYQPDWAKMGDLSREYLNGFLAKAPYYFTTLSALLLFFHHQFLLYVTLTLMMFYVYLLSMKSKVTKTPQMGQISLANSELLKNKDLRKPVYYFAKFGTIVKDFKATTPEEARAIDLLGNNILYEYLLDKANYTMHILLAGTTGAGKTVSLTSSVIHPCIVSGSGFLYIEGKGDLPISESVYSLCVEHGREDDFFFFDFGAVTSGGYSHSVAPLEAGGAVVLNETLTNLIDIMTGDNSWVSDMATEFMIALLFPLVVFRDLNLMVSPEDLKTVEKLSDFDEKIKVNFNLTLLSMYLNYQSAIDVVYAFRTLLKDQAFVTRLRNHKNHRAIGDYTIAYLFPLLNFLQNRSVDVSNLLERPNYMDVKPETQKQNNYAINPWTKALMNFGNEAIYGRIFNREYADISILEVIRNGKIAVFSLPSMQNSSEKNQKIGLMLTALAKTALGVMLSKGEMQGSMAEKAAQKRYRPYKVPFMFVFDEISNFGNEMMGQMASMIRSMGTDGGGMGMVISGQSLSDLEKIGEGGHSGEQLKDNMGIAYFLNISGEGYPELASKYCGKKWEYDLKKDSVVSEGKDSDKSSIMQNLERKEVDRYPVDYFTKNLQKQSGEGIIVQNGFLFPEKIVANYIEPKIIHNDGKKHGVKLAKNISHEKLMSYFKHIDEEEIQNITAQKPEEKKHGEEAVSEKDHRDED